MGNIAFSDWCAESIVRDFAVTVPAPVDVTKPPPFGETGQVMSSSKWIIEGTKRMSILFMGI